MAFFYTNVQSKPLAIHVRLRQKKGYMRHQPEEYPVLRLNQFDKANEVYFYANTFSDHVERFHHRIMSPHAHDFFALMVFTNGSGWHEVDFTRNAIQPHAFFFLRPGQLHSWEFTPETEGYVILFSEKFLTHYLGAFPFSRNRLFDKAAALSHVLLTEDAASQVIERCSAMYIDYMLNDSYSNTMCSAWLSLLFSILGRHLDTGERNVSLHAQSLFEKFSRLIDQHYNTKHEVSDYASLLAVSPRHLSRITQEAAGSSPGDLVRSRLVLEARKLLVTEDEPVAVIAEKLGFEDSSWFSKWFKKQTGRTPVQFRKNYQ